MKKHTVLLSVSVALLCVAALPPQKNSPKLKTVVAAPAAVVANLTVSSPGYQVRLLWTPSPDTNVVGYNIFSGGASRTYTNEIDAGNVVQTTISGLAANTTYYFTAAAYDVSGNESPFCNEVAYTTPIQLGLGNWPAIVLPAMVSTDIVNWQPTNFVFVLTNQSGNQFFRFGTPATVTMTNYQPLMP